MFSALSDATRVQILFKLRSGELGAGALAEQLKTPPSSLTFHLNRLVSAGLLSMRRAGRERFYRLSPVVRKRSNNLLIAGPGIRITLSGDST